MRSAPSQGSTRGGRPRDPTAEGRILAATRQELAERGFSGFSVRNVARRAGVARPSVALRWPDWRAMVIEALDGWNELPGRHDHGSLREDLVHLADDFAVMLEPPGLGFQLRLGAEAPQEPELYDLYLRSTLRPRVGTVQAAFERAQSRGEIAADIDVQWETDAFVGALLMRTMGRRGQRPPGRPARRAFVDQTVRKLAVATRTGDRQWVG